MGKKRRGFNIQRIYLSLLLFISSICITLYAQVLITEETFDEAAGSISGVMSNGETWNARIFGNCPPGNGVGVWGVGADGRFVVNDIEGFDCCECVPGSGGTDCGNAGNYIQFGPIDISAYTGGISFEFEFTPVGNFECYSQFGSTGSDCPNEPASVSCRGGSDQAIFSYQVDGKPYEVFGYYCGDQYCYGANHFCNDVIGEELYIELVLGNQSMNEFYYLDNLQVFGYEQAKVNIEITPGVVVCEGETVTLTENAGYATSWSWHGPPGSHASQSWVINSVDENDEGLYTVEITSANGCTSSKQVQLMVNPRPDAGIPDLSDICIDDAVHFDLGDLVNTIKNGSDLDVTFYEGDPENGGIEISPIDDIDLTQIHSLWIKLGVGDVCIDIVQIPFNIILKPTFNIGPFCESDAHFQLPQDSDTPGVWSGMGVSNGEFNPGIGGGNYTLTYTTDDGNCAFEYEIIVMRRVDLQAPQYGSLCEYSGAIDLPQIIDGVRGTWSGEGVDGNTFDPNSVGEGSYNITFTPNDPCVEPTTITLTVNSKPEGKEIAIEICSNENPVIFDLVHEEYRINRDPGLTFTWYQDMALNLKISTPNNYQSGNAVVYVQIDNGVCLSDPIPVQLIISSGPTLSPIDDIRICEGEELILFGDTYTNAAYEWTGPNGFFSQDQVATVSTNASIEMSGTYTFTVIQEDCHPAFIEVEVIVSPRPDFTLEVTPAICFNDSATITVVNKGGGMFDQYDWNGTEFDGQDEILTDNHGVHEVEIVNEHGCTHASSVDISFPDTLDIMCQLGNENGTAIITISGGVEPYGELKWEGVTNGSKLNPTEGDHLIINLEEDIYKFTVIDANGCENVCFLNIVYSSCVLEAEIVIDSTILCFGGRADFHVDILEGKNIQDLTYSWDSGLSPDSAQTNIQAGTYRVTIANPQILDCQRVLNIRIEQPDELTIDCQLIQETSGMGNSDGKIEVSWSGGTGLYKIEWDGPISGNEENITSPFTISHLAEGDYHIIVTDSSGCKVTCQSTVQVSECETEVEIIQIDSILCSGDSTASVTVQIASGFPPYHYEWDASSLDTDTITNIPAGFVRVTVTDVNNCSSTATIEIMEPEPIELTCTPFRNSFRYSIMGGTPPYELWVVGVGGGSTGTNTTIEGIESGEHELHNLEQGEYVISVIDSFGCIVDCMFVLNSVECEFEASISVLDTITCPGGDNGSIILDIIPMGMYDVKWADNQSSDLSRENLSAGTYTVYVEKDGCIDTVSIVLKDPEGFEVGIQVLDTISCFGFQDGRLGITFTPPTGVYSIEWEDGSSSIERENLGAGTYTIIADKNGCSDTASVELIEPEEFSVDIQVLDSISCHNEDDGKIMLELEPPQDLYEIEWEDGSKDIIREDLDSGTYSVIVEKNGCKDTATVMLENPEEFEIKIIGPEAICEGEEAFLSANGDFTSIEWFPGNKITPDISVRSGGMYTVIAYNSNGCIATDTIRITTHTEKINTIKDTICAFDTIFVNNTAYYSGNLTGEEIFPGESGKCDSIVRVELFSKPSGFELQLIEPDCEGPFHTMVSMIENGEHNAPYDIYVDNGFLETVHDLPYEFQSLSEGMHTIRIVDAIGCVFEKNINITQILNTSINVKTTYRIIEGDTVELIAIVSTPYDTLYWEPRDMVTCPNCDTTYSSPLSNQTYTVYVLNEAGCIVSQQVYIEVTDGSGIYIPTAFSPDGDGTNDTYNIYYGPGVKGIRSFKIFDRWGNQLYSENYTTAQRPRGWDGRYKRAELDPDVYVLTFVVEYIDGSTKEVSETILLLK